MGQSKKFRLGPDPRYEPHSGLRWEEYRRLMGTGEGESEEIEAPPTPREKLSALLWLLSPRRILYVTLCKIFGRE